MKVLVTGGAGFIGSHLTDLLAARGHDVLVIDNLRTGAKENLRGALATGRVRLETADVLDAAVFNELARTFSPQAIVHLAALVSVQEARQAPDENFRLNLETTQRVISVAHRFGVGRVVFASSAAIYGDNPAVPLRESESLNPLGLYGAAKAASELMLLSSGRELEFDAVPLRFFNVFGPRQRADSPYSGVISIFADRIARGLPIAVFGEGNQTRDFISVRDVAAAICSAAEHPTPIGRALNICTGRATSLLDLIASIERATGYPISIEYRPARMGDIVHSCGDPNAAAKAIEFRAHRKLDADLAELLSIAQQTAGATPTLK